MLSITPYIWLGIAMFGVGFWIVLDVKPKGIEVVGMILAIVITLSLTVGIICSRNDCYVKDGDMTIVPAKEPTF